MASLCITMFHEDVTMKVCAEITKGKMGFIVHRKMHVLGTP